MPSPGGFHEAEWLTRKKRIDARLKQTGWKLLSFSPRLDLKTLDKCAVEEFPTGNGPADYALFVSGQCLGIVEAKKVTVNPQNVLEQANDMLGVFSTPLASGTISACLFSTQAMER